MTLHMNQICHVLTIFYCDDPLTCSSLLVENFQAVSFPPILMPACYMNRSGHVLTIFYWDDLRKLVLSIFIIINTLSIISVLLDTNKNYTFYNHLFEMSLY